MAADLSALAEPVLLLTVEKDHDVLATREHDVEVAAVDRLLRPPAVDDSPLLTEERDLLPIDAPRRPVDVRLDERLLRRV